MNQGKQMNNSSRVLAVVGVLLVLVFSALAGLILLNSERIVISFIPDHSNTIPGETGWFLVEIQATSEITDYEIAVDTNCSVETGYKYWAQTPLLEVFVYPNASHVDHCIEIEVSFTWGELVAHDSAFLYVLNWTSEGLDEIIEKRDVFIDFLAVNHPEFGIDNNTTWTPIYNCAGIIIVGHHLFKSAEWEMEVSWHVMIAPYDWVQVYLRPRAESTPSWAGTINSWSTDNGTVVETDPPTEIYRPM
jgi:hypothetical protein